MVGGQSAVDGDVLPYGLVVGNRAKLAGLNLVGLRQREESTTDSSSLYLHVMAQSELYHNNCRRCATSIMSIDMPAFKLLHWIAQWNNQRDAPPTPDQADEGAYGCTKIFSKARQLEVTIEHSDELPFGAYSHPQVRVHIVDRCTGRALCPPQMTSEAKFCMDNNANCSK
ncbi:Udp N-acetylglucosamine O-acyltransferase, C-terminal [Phytophthora cactorum]|nr:Udp N-acetylglucosamine O-acyltransferase, C-terminal [Phytophthora cactorum]